MGKMFWIILILALFSVGILIYLFSAGRLQAESLWGDNQVIQQGFNKPAGVEKGTYQEITYTPTSRTWSNPDGTTTIELGGTYALDNGVWKDTRDIKSLKGKGYTCLVSYPTNSLSVEDIALNNLDVKCVDFNSTSRTLQITSKVPVTIAKDFPIKTPDSKGILTTIQNLNIKDTKTSTIIVPAKLGQEVHIGEKSINVTIEGYQNYGSKTEQSSGGTNDYFAVASADRQVNIMSFDLHSLPRNIQITKTEFQGYAGFSTTDAPTCGGFNTFLTDDLGIEFTPALVTGTSIDYIDWEYVTNRSCYMMGGGNCIRTYGNISYSSGVFNCSVPASNGSIYYPLLEGIGWGRVDSYAGAGTMNRTNWITLNSNASIDLQTLLAGNPAIESNNYMGIGIAGISGAWYQESAEAGYDIRLRVTYNSPPTYSYMSANQTYAIKGQNINFSATITDDEGVSSAYFTYKFNATWVNSSLININAIQGNISQVILNISNVTYPGQYKWCANDSRNFWSCSNLNDYYVFNIPLGTTITRKYQNNGTENRTIDNWMDQNSAYRNTNHGTATQIDLSSTSGYLHYGLIEFNVSDIPSNAVITSATLSLWRETTSSGTTMRFHRVFKPWTELTSSWNNWTATGRWGVAGASNISDSGVDNTGDGTDYDMVSTYNYQQNTPSWTAGWMNTTITSAVQNWVNGSWENNGLKLLSIYHGRREVFTSAQGTTASRRPTLTVTYQVSDVITPAGYIYAPANNSKIGWITNLKTIVSDNKAVDYISFDYSNATSTNVLIPNCEKINYPTTTCAWDTRNFGNDTYDIRLSVYDIGGNVFRNYSTYQVDNNIPDLWNDFQFYPTFTSAYNSHVQSSVKNGDEFNYDIVGTDASGINWSYTNINLLNGTTGEVPMTFKSGSLNPNAYATFTMNVTINTSVNGWANINFYIYDNATPNNLKFDNFRVEIDNEAPAWSNLNHTEEPLYVGDNITYFTSISDNHNISWYIFSTNKSGSWANISYNYTGNPTSGTLSNYTTATASGSYASYFIIYDDAGNYNQTDIDYTTISGEAIPIVNLIEPVEDYNSTTAEMNFTYNYTGINNSQACELAINGQINLTTTDPVNDTTLYFYQNFSDGEYDWQVRCNNSAGSWGYSEVRYFNIITGGATDTIAPTIDIVYPPLGFNTTHYDLDVNFTAFDETAIADCWWSDDYGETNVSGTCGTNLTGAWVEGQNNITIWVNDTSGNENSSFVSFRVDTHPPYFNELPLNVELTEGQGYLNDINGTDLGIGMVYYGVNTSNFTINASGFIDNASELIIGLYWVNISINDTLNKNSTVFYINVTIGADTTPPYFTTIPPNTTITYGENFLVDFEAEDETAFGNYSVNWTSNFNINGSGWLYNITPLSAGTYNLNVSINDTSGNRNETIFNLTINQATGNVTLKINHTESNFTSYNNTILGYETWLNATLINGTGNIEIWINGTLYNNGTSPTANFTNLTFGYYNASAVYSGNINYTGYIETWWINITATSPPAVDSSTPILSNFLLSPANNSEYNYLRKYYFNVSITNSNGTAGMEFNGTNYTMTNVTINFTASLSLGAGTYPYYFWSWGNGSTNIYNHTEYNFYTVKINSSLALGLTGTTPIGYGATTDFTGSGCPSEVGAGSCWLNISNQDYSAGTTSANYSMNSSNNYTSTSAVFTITINQEIGEVWAYINHSRVGYNNTNDTATSRANVYLNASLAIGIGQISLWLNGTPINTGTAFIYNITNLSLGYYNMSAVYPGNENYSADIETWWINISIGTGEVPAPPSNVTVTQTATCRYKKFVYYNLKLPFYKQQGCI